VYDCYAPVTVGAAILLSDSPCQYGRLPSSPCGKIPLYDYSNNAVGVKTLLSSRELLLNFKSNYEHNWAPSNHRTSVLTVS
jgi:hypothetical protein